MSDMSTPAGNSGGDTTTPIAAALAELPARIRVHALAKLLGRSSREVLAAVTELGADGRSVQSSIDRELALRVAEALGVTAPDPDAAEAAPAEAAPPAVESAQDSSAGSRTGFRQAGVQAPGFRQTTRPAPAAGSPGFTAPAQTGESPSRVTPPTPVFASASPLFLPPEPTAAPTRPARPAPERPAPEPEVVEDEAEETDESFAEDADEGRPRRRRGRRGRGRGKGGQDEPGAEETAEEQEKPDKAEKQDKPGKRAKAEPKAESEPEETDDQEAADGDDPASRRRRRRRRRRGGDADEATGSATEDDPPNTVVHVREAREDKEKPESDGRDEVRSVRGSTRLEAKRQRRRDGREAGRRRAPILSEAEFLARREAVDRAMVIRERGDRIQIGVLEDGVLVEHFVTSAGSGSLVGNVYLGRVQNVLPSMEAAFVDIGRGRNAVLYAGEVDWDAAGLEGKARKIEQALSTGDSVLVQVTKDPVGHKGARLTTQISLPGRFLVYVPGGGATGISRKLPENERRRLKDVLKRVVPEDAGVIIRTASEGISEEELARDVRRLQAQWQVIKDKTEGTNGVRRVGAPSLVYEEPDLLVKVVRDLFTEDFSALVVQGDTAWETVDAYVRHVAPELADRLRKHVANSDVFAEYRIDEQLLKALDRKVWLPSGGYLVIDRTEAMTVIDVNTGKFTGSGGNLEETVTRNNLESAEEIVRQLRLRDIGGIIVIDFIDMVLESNRDLVLRRLTECLGRDRTRHQVAEVTSLGLVQMTRKRVGTGLLEAFGTTCEHCKGRGVLVSTEPVSKPNGTNGQSEPTRGGNTRRSRGRGEEKDQKDKSANSANKDAAKEAAAQAAKDAVRDIAKATTKVTEPKPADTPATSTDTPTTADAAATETPAADASTADASTAHATKPAESTKPAEGGKPAGDATKPAEAAVEATEQPTRGRFRHRTRDRSHRAASRNGVSSDHATSATGTPEPPTATEPSTTEPSPTEHRNGSAAPSAASATQPTSGTPTDQAEPPGSGVPAASAPSAASATPNESPAPADSTDPSGTPSDVPSSETRPSGSPHADQPSAGPDASTSEAPVSEAPAPVPAISETPATAEPSTASAPTSSGPSATSVAPAHGVPTHEVSAHEASAQGAATREASAQGAATREASAQSASAPGASAHGVPAQEASAHGASADGVSAHEAPAREASAPAAAHEESSAGDAASEVPSAQEAPEASDEAPSVPAPTTPPRRQPRRAASRPAGPPVSARHDG